MAGMRHGRNHGGLPGMILAMRTMEEETAVHGKDAA
jgi:hypothetical protein